MGVDTIRVPVADWMYVPYPPYIHCWDGSLEVLDRLFRWCEKYSMNVILDVHTEVFSQNPFDNSGRADKIIWTSNNTYTHEYQANWFGQFDNITQKYESMNMTHMYHALNVVQKLVDMYKNTPAVIGIEPINEPWAPVPIKHLKSFYYDVYTLIQTQVPNWITLFHDSFRLSVDLWGGFLLNCPNFAMDTHIYLAWSEVHPHWVYQNAACNNAVAIRNMESAGLPVVVGEWSLATSKYMYVVCWCVCIVCALYR